MSERTPAPGAKERMLATIRDYQRKVETGELVGLILMGVKKDDYITKAQVGEPPGPHGCLLLQGIAADAKDHFLGTYVEPDDGKPLMAPVPARKPPYEH